MKKVTMFATAAAVEEAFYEALEAGDVETVMQLWSEDEEVVCVHPGGIRAVGVSAVRATMQNILSNGGIDIRPTEVRIHQSATMAVHHLIEQVLINGDRGTEVVQIAATNIYVNGPSGWQLYLHQSTPLDSDSGPAAHGNQPVLH
jgi:uncharacterized protein (TIGR02246 family)